MVILSLSLICALAWYCEVTMKWQMHILQCLLTVFIQFTDISAKIEIIVAVVGKFFISENVQVVFMHPLYHLERDRIIANDVLFDRYMMSPAKLQNFFNRVL
ncbi:MAG: hypothetical protein IGNPGNKH_00274 [Sodalis sp. Ffu]|nr:MAG: hypothetical protein IGNPGNKH_00274 [Sodalis sp. Ffu]